MTQSPQDIAKLFAYTWWATAKILETAAQLTPEEYARPIGGSFGSVQGTLTHVYGADWVWLERWHGRSPTALPGHEAAADLADLAEKWRAVELKQKQYLEGLTVEGLQKSLSYVNFAGQTWTYPMDAVLVHVTNHSTYHRGQVVTLLRQLGKTPVSTDYLRFLDAGG